LAFWSSYFHLLRETGFERSPVYKMRPYGSIL